MADPKRIADYLSIPDHSDLRGFSYHAPENFDFRDELRAEHAPQKGGWTSRDDETAIPRKDELPTQFYAAEKPGDPACAAWDEAGYVDPDNSHKDLPLGTRYWQGYAKSATPRALEKERALSPEWVTRMTERGGQLRPPPFDPEDDPDPLREHVVREKETDRLSNRPETFWPG